VEQCARTGVHALAAEQVFVCCRTVEIRNEPPGCRTGIDRDSASRPRSGECCSHTGTVKGCSCWQCQHAIENCHGRGSGGAADACVNMMGLLLARASERSGDVAMRLNLGASPMRIMRQFATENLVLVSIGTVLGLGLAATLVRVVRESNFGNLPRVSGIDIDARVF